MNIENNDSSPDIAELAMAMVKVQQALTPACKDAENPFVKNRYASLNSVIEACRDALINDPLYPPNGSWQRPPFFIVTWRASS